MQKALCAAFEKVLGIENVGIDDSFFALGGDSIRSAALAAECRVYGIRTADIFAGITPRDIEKAVLSKADFQRLTRKEKREIVYPLTPYERGMYIEQKMSPDSTAYLLNLIFDIKGAGTEKTASAVKSVFALHEAFRSRYAERNGVPVRIVTDGIPEISVSPAASYEQARREAEGYAEPFDLSAGIPVRTVDL